MPTFAAVFAAIDRVQAAVLPVENSLGGVVQEVSDLLWAHREATVVAEHVTPIRHLLLAPAEGPVHRALSHPQALAQCAGWLAARGITPVPAHDTAGAARQVAEDRRPGEAAIAGEGAAARYGLRVLARDIADQPSNRTRFLVVVRGTPDLTTPADGSKLSLGFVTPHRPGALHAVLEVLAARGLNLTRLDSRPVPELPFNYRFYADVELSQGLAGAAVLEALADRASELRAFGVYPAATPPEAGRN